MKLIHEITSKKGHIFKIGQVKLLVNMKATHGVRILLKQNKYVSEDEKCFLRRVKTINTMDFCLYYDDEDILPFDDDNIFIKFL